jgi:hypothetical protein
MTITDLLVDYIDRVVPVLQEAKPVIVGRGRIVIFEPALFN